MLRHSAAPITAPPHSEVNSFSDLNWRGTTTGMKSLVLFILLHLGFMVCQGGKSFLHLYIFVFTFIMIL